MATPQTKAVIAKELTGLQAAGGYTFDELYRFAQICQASGLFEDVADAAQAFIKIAKGQEMGLPPTTAMSAFDLIKKRLFIKPWVIAAKINASGYGSYQVLTQTPEQCTIAFARKYHGKGWTDLPPVSYTLVEAKAHGLINRSPHWQSSPAHMLYQRAMGRGGAMYFPELLAGLEPPQDDTPIPAERHRQNIVDLFGDGAGSYAPQRHTPKNAREGTVLQRTDVEQGVDTQEANYGPVSGLKSASTPSTMQGAAWDTLRAHQDDARLPPEILERIAAALSPLAPATDTEALALADVVLQWVDSFDDSNVEE